MDAAIKSEMQSQKLYDLLQQSGGHGATIEFIMRSIDQEELVAAFNQFPPIIQPPTTTPTQPQQASSSSNNGITLHYPTTPNITPVARNLQQHQDLGSFNTSSTSSNTPPTPEIDSNNASVLNNFEVGGELDGNRPHICTLCQATYKTRTHLRRHMMIHLNNRPYPCSDCGKGFNRKEHLNKHIEAVHSLTKHRCQYCGKEISRRDHLSRHIKNMHPAFAHTIDGSPYAPENSSAILKISVPCAQKQKAQLSFLTPVVTQTNYENTPTMRRSSPHSSSSSPGGGEGGDRSQAASSSSTSTHTQHSQENQQRMSQSDEDDDEEEEEDSSSNSPLAQYHHQHQNNNNNNNNGHNLDSESYQQQVYGAVPMLSVPIASTSSQARSISNSKATPKKSDQNGLLGLTNLSMTLGGQIKESPFANCSDPKSRFPPQHSQVFQCSECTSTFSSEKDLTCHHMRNHKPQNYRCTECPRAYTRREKLTEHVRCFHQGQKFRCEHCGKELSRKDHVLRHVRSIHPELLATKLNASSELHEDLIVPIVTLDESMSSHQHLQSSSNAKGEMGSLLRSICQYCLKVFGTSYHLRRHIESCHNGDIRPYPCMSCSKQFKRKDHLTKHIKSHCPSIREAVSTLNSSNSASASSLIQSLKQFQTSSSPSPNQKLKSKRKSSRNHIKTEKSNNVKEGVSSKCQKNGEKNNSQQPRICGDGQEIEMKEGDEFNLAMINSFMAENVNVVVEEEDLSSLIHSHQQQQQATPLQPKQEFVSTCRNSNSSSSSSSSSSSASSSPEEMRRTLPCGHCQKEFRSRDELLDHLQVHNNDQDGMEQNETSANNSQQCQGLRSIQFSNY